MVAGQPSKACELKAEPHVLTLERSELVGEELLQTNFFSAPDGSQFTLTNISMQT
jgi:hypothetical protein